jgi:hypothetical protein
MLPPLFAGATGDPALPRRLDAVNIETIAYQTVFARELVRHSLMLSHRDHAGGRILRTFGSHRIRQAMARLLTSTGCHSRR